MVENIERKYIRSLTHFMDELMKKIEEVGGGTTVWFRGVASEEYKLIPSLYRKPLNVHRDYDDISNYKINDTRKIATIEKNIDFDFSRIVTTFFAKKGIEDTEWNRYSLKQHYGVKTRLLDWTENALMALFFAVKDSVENKSNKNARVWLLSPFNLNDYSVRKLYKYSLTNLLTNGENLINDNLKSQQQQQQQQQQQTFKHILPFFELKKDSNKPDLINDKGEIRLTQLFRKYYFLECNEDEEMFPLAIHPQHLDERMAAQQSCFTLFGNIINGLDISDSERKFIDYIDIDTNFRLDILKELHKIGISYFSIYPDLDGLGRAINYRNLDELSRALTYNFLSNIK